MMTPQLWTPPKPRIIAPHVYPVEIVERHAAPALGIGVGIGFPHSSTSSSPHPALAYGGIAVFSVSAPSYYDLNGSDVAAHYNVLDLESGTYDLAQGTASLQHTYEATGWAGTTPSFLAAGGEWTESAALGAEFSGKQSITVIQAIEVTADVTGACWSLYGAGGDDLVGYYLSGGGWRLLRATSALKVANAGSPTINTRYIMAWVYDGSAETGAIYQNGSLLGPPGSLSMDPATFNSFKLSAAVTGVPDRINARYGDTWVCNAALNASQVAAATAIIAADYPYA